MKPLIAWFSWSGTSERTARRLKELTKGASYQIRRDPDYSRDYWTCADVEAKREYEQQTFPRLREPLPDIEEFDVVYLVFPIWWYTAPLVVQSFLKSVGPFDKKTVYVFANSYGKDRRQFEDAVETVRKLAVGANVLPGLYNDDALEEWLEGKHE